MAESNTTRRWRSSPIVWLVTIVLLLLAGWYFALSPRSSVVSEIPINAELTIKITRHWKFDVGYPMFVYEINERDGRTTTPYWFYTGDPLPRLKTVGKPRDRYVALVAVDDPDRVMIAVDTKTLESWPRERYEPRAETSRAQMLEALRTQTDNPALRISDD